MMMSNCVQPNRQLTHVSGHCWYTLKCMPRDPQTGRAEWHCIIVLSSAREQSCKWPLGVAARFYFNSHQTLVNARSSHDACGAYTHAVSHNARCADCTCICCTSSCPSHTCVFMTQCSCCKQMSRSGTHTAGPVGMLLLLYSFVNQGEALSWLSSAAAKKHLFHGKA